MVFLVFIFVIGTRSSSGGVRWHHFSEQDVDRSSIIHVCFPLINDTDIATAYYSVRFMLTAENLSHGTAWCSLVCHREVREALFPATFTAHAESQWQTIGHSQWWYCRHCVGLRLILKVPLSISSLLPSQFTLGSCDCCFHCDMILPSLRIWPSLPLGLVPFNYGESRRTFNSRC